MRLRSARVVAAACAVAFTLSACAAPTPSLVAPSSAPRDSGAAGPAAPEVDPTARYVDARLKTMSLREMVATLFMLHYPGTSVGPIRDFVAKYRPGGLILMGDNVPAESSRLARMIPRFSPDPGLPILTAIDQEGGIVRRIASDVAPAGAQLRSLPPSASKAAFASRASVLKRLGVAINFGIIADETSDPTSFIYSRVLGTTPKDSAARVAAAVVGESGKVLSTLKHFPGHGAVAGDSHASIPTTGMTYAKWLATAAVPFEKGIAAGAEVVMFGHLRFGTVDSAPATLSKKWHEILRDRLGFTGLIVTDDMLMLQRSGDPRYRNAARNAIAALAAGNTMLLYVLPAHPADVGFRPDAVIDAVVAAVRDGRIPVTTIEQDARLVLMARRALSGQSEPFVHCDEDCAARAR